MNKIVLVAALIAVAVSGCATDPRKTSARLDTSAPKFDSRPCLEARVAAESYKSEIGKRMFQGAMLGLIPIVGIGLAAEGDLHKNAERRRLNDAVMLHCAGTDATPDPAQTATPAGGL